MNVLGSALMYGGLIASLVGIVSVVWPLRWLRIRTRRKGALVAAAGAAAIVTSLLLPVTTTRSTSAERIDSVIPAYEFREFHTVHVQAPRAQVYRAIQDVTPEDITLYRTLVAIRSPRFLRGGQEDILNPTPGRPILETALRTSFLMLAEVPDQEMVLGTLIGAPVPEAATWTPAMYVSFDRAGYAKAVMNFLVLPLADGGSLVTTETRVITTDARSRRQFAAYWRLIYPGSALIRKMWLRAIKARAERAPAVL